MKIRFLKKAAFKFIEKQPQKQRERIMAAVKKLPEGDIVPVEGMPGYYRMRVGGYRVVYTIDYTEKMIYVYHVGNRGDVYKAI